MVLKSLLGLWLAGWLAALAFAPAAAAATQPAHEFTTASTIIRADDLIGRLVETRDGEELGRVRDVALDLNSGRVAYVVVTVGSFLIEESLIAVEPQALRASADADGRLVLEADADSLRSARRFSGGDWPLRADVVAAATRRSDAGDRQAAAADGDANGAADRTERGSATISDGTRTATLSAGERSIRTAEPADAGRTGRTSGTENPDGPDASGASSASPGGPARGPRADFDRLDRDGTGTLDRVQIAHELRPGDRYSDIDTNNDGVIQRSEYEAWVRGRTSEGQPSSE